MDQRIADFIRDHRKQYTREAITQQLLDAGYEREAIDATWAALDTPDPDDTAEGGFWGRWFLILIGINLAVLAIVGLATGAFFVPERIGLLGVLAVVLAIGALISWGLVAAVGPGRLGRTTATVVGIVIPLVIALLLGGACLALLSGLGPPPRTGTMELNVDGMPDASGSGTATCFVSTADAFSVFAQLDVAQDTTVDVNSYPPDGGPPTGEVENVLITMPGSGPEQLISYGNTSGQAQLSWEVRASGLGGSVTFNGLPSESFEGGVEGGAPEPISGTVSWDCE